MRWGTPRWGMTTVTIRRTRTTPALEFSISISWRRWHVSLIVIAAIRRTIEISIISAVPTTAVGRVWRRMMRRREIGISGGWWGGRWRRRWRWSGRGRGFVERIGGNVGDNFCHWEMGRNPNEAGERERERVWSVCLVCYIVMSYQSVWVENWIGLLLLD